MSARNKARKTLLADLLRISEVPVVQKVELPLSVEQANLYYQLGRRDLLAEQCAVIDMRGVQALVNDIPLMLQKFDPDHFLAKRVLRAHHPRHKKAA